MKIFCIWCCSIVILASSSACSSVFSKEAAAGLLIGTAAGGAVGPGIGASVGNMATNMMNNAAIGAGVGLIGGSYVHDYDERNGKIPTQVVREPEDQLKGELLESQKKIDSLREEVSDDTKWQPSSDAVRQLKAGYYESH